ncbi:Pvc16 family protein [Amycolatopsis sp. NBC_00438]|uniref:Pvc16 family protein n=1 Tax=Amycolatopsis sp. NBC_00438 TaxID=2903558 RepID=UPI002E1E0049
MIRDVDDAVSALLRRYLDDETVVSLGRPGAEPPGEHAVLHLVLHGIAEAADGRGAAEWSEVRDARGQVVGRQPPLRRYRMRYVISARAATPEAEHAALDTVLAACAIHDVLPGDVAGERLAATGFPVTLEITGPAAAHPGELGTGPGGAHLLLDVTAPLLPPMLTDIPAKVEQLQLEAGAHDERARDRTVAGHWRSVRTAPDSRWSQVRVRERVRPGDDRTREAE